MTVSLNRRIIDNVRNRLRPQIAVTVSFTVNPERIAVFVPGYRSLNRCPVVNTQTGAIKLIKRTAVMIVVIDTDSFHCFGGGRGGYINSRSDDCQSRSRDFNFDPGNIFVRIDTRNRLSSDSRRPADQFVADGLLGLDVVKIIDHLRDNLQGKFDAGADKHIREHTRRSDDRNGSCCCNEK